MPGACTCSSRPFARWRASSSRACRPCGARSGRSRSRSRFHRPPVRRSEQSGGSETVASESKTGSAAGHRPLNVTEARLTEPAGLPVASLDKSRFLPATGIDTPQRYALADLFDGNPGTYLKLVPPATDIDFIIEFPFAEPVTISGLQIDAGEAGGAEPCEDRGDGAALGCDGRRRAPGHDARVVGRRRRPEVLQFRPPQERAPGSALPPVPAPATRLSAT